MDAMFEQDDWIKPPFDMFDLMCKVAERTAKAVPGVPITVRAAPEPVIVQAFVCKNTDREYMQYGNAVLMCEWSDGTITDELYWYNDELWLSADEFIGMTKRQAHDHKCDADKRYIMS